MYGSTMIGTLAAGATADDVRAAIAAWAEERKVDGFLSSHVMLADDERTVVNVAVFQSKEQYLALADDPAQDEWWTTRFAPLLDGEPRWIDGAWIS